MKRLLALMCAVSIIPNFQLLKVLEEQRFIEENNLVRVKVSCYYAEPGAHTADGSIPVEGMVSSNREHLGMDMILYTDDLFPEARFQCTDIGGHKMLREGTAVDFYRDDYSRCVSFVKSHSAYVWVQWVDRSEGKDGETVSGNSVESGYEGRLQERKRVNDKTEARPDIR